MPDVLEHWNERATLGQFAGTWDWPLVALERRVIRRHVRPGMRVLDIGCGVGETLARLPHNVARVGVDFSPAMLAMARRRAPEQRFEVLDLLDEDWPALGQFDLVYTQRCLINLPDWAAQAKAIRRILFTLVKRGGSYLALEHSQTGLDRLNVWRQRVGLTPIGPGVEQERWHNRYLVDAEVRVLLDWHAGSQLVDEAVDFSSTYYGASRVLNGWWAQRRGGIPSYGAWINRLALHLPVFGKVGQARYWRWVKA